MWQPLHVQVYDSSAGATPNFTFEAPLVPLEPPNLPADPNLVKEEETDSGLHVDAPPAVQTQGSVDFLTTESPLSMAPPAENGHASGGVFDTPLENAPISIVSRARTSLRTFGIEGVEVSVSRCACCSFS